MNLYSSGFAYTPSSSPQKSSLYFMRKDIRDEVHSRLFNPEQMRYDSNFSSARSKPVSQAMIALPPKSTKEYPKTLDMQDIWQSQVNSRALANSQPYKSSVLLKGQIKIDQQFRKAPQTINNTLTTSDCCTNPKPSFLGNSNPQLRKIKSNTYSSDLTSLRLQNNTITRNLDNYRPLDQSSLFQSTPKPKNISGFWSVNNDLSVEDLMNLSKAQHRNRNTLNNPFLRESIDKQGHQGNLSRILRNYNSFNEY